MKQNILLHSFLHPIRYNTDEIEARIEFVRGLGNDALASLFSENVSKVYGCL